jgi:hypothetical protein
MHAGKPLSLSPTQHVILEATEGTLTSDTDHAATRNFEDSDSPESEIDVPNMARWGIRYVPSTDCHFRGTPPVDMQHAKK